MENNSLPLRKKISEELFIRLQSTTSHGIPRIVSSSNKVSRVFWAICFLISVSYCIYQISQCLIAFLSYNVIVSIQKVKNSAALFPAVTFCNINPFDETSDNFSILLNNTDNGYCFSSNLNTSIINLMFDIFIDQLKRVYANDQTVKDRLSYGHDIKNMLISCNYNGITCSYADFTKYWHYQFGACYTFNSGSPNFTTFKAGMTGNQNGLKMELVVRK